jgi:hypothetical protein
MVFVINLQLIFSTNVQTFDARLARFPLVLKLL